MKINCLPSKRGRLPVWLALILVASILIPFLLGGDPYLMHLAVSFLIYCTLATNLNLVVGYAGQVSFAHAAFFGIGAYTSSLLGLRLGCSFWLGILAAFLLVTTLALGIGIPTLRLRGSYLTICTMGLQLIAETLMLKWVALTNGPLGLTNIPSPTILGISLDNPSKYFYLTYLWFLFNILILWRVEASRAGFEMLAIREDEDAASASGINASALKLWAFSVSAGLAGGTGAVYAHYMHSIDPSPFQMGMSSIILVMVILGGRGTIIGGAVGALLLSLLPEWMRTLQEYRMMVYGLIMIVLVMFAPKGLLGLGSALRNSIAVGKERVKNRATAGN